MSETPNVGAPVYLREQFWRMHTRLDRIAEDVTNLNLRGSAVAADLGYVRIGLAEVNGRPDRLDARIERVERRLDLTDAPVH